MFSCSYSFELLVSPCDSLELLELLSPCYVILPGACENRSLELPGTPGGLSVFIYTGAPCSSLELPGGSSPSLKLLEAPLNSWRLELPRLPGAPWNSWRFLKVFPWSSLELLEA